MDRIHPFVIAVGVLTFVVFGLNGNHYDTYVPEDTNFVVLIVLKSSNYTKVCAGSLIDPSWILTTATCVANVKANIENITTFQTIKPKINLITNISTIITHEAYYFWDNNIALIKLWDPVPATLFESNVKVSQNKDLPADGLLLSWNKDNNDPDRISETVLDFKESEKRFKGTFALKKVKNGYYFGISGAPIVKKSDKWELVGMYSHTSLLFDSSVENNDYNYVDLTMYYGWIFRKLSARPGLGPTTDGRVNGTEIPE